MSRPLVPLAFFTLALSALFIGTAFADPLLTIVPNNPATTATNFDVTYTADGGVHGYIWFRPDGSVCTWDNGGTQTQTADNLCTVGVIGANHALYFLYSDTTNCRTGGSTYAGCLGGGNVVEDVCVDVGNTGACSVPPPPAPSTWHGQLIRLSDASTTLTAAAALSVPIFRTLIPLAAAVIGLLIAGYFIAALRKTLITSTKRGLRKF